MALPAGVVDPFNVAAMAQKILWLQDNPMRLIEMKKDAQQRVQQLFSQEKRLSNLIVLIKTQCD